MNIPSCSNLYDEDIIVANIASIPERLKSLLKVVNSVLPQVNYLNIILNKYQSIPLELLAFNNEKINITLDPEDEWQERSKFLFVDKTKGYYFTIDDDIIYPSDYIEKMINAIEFYKRKAIICVHANNLNRNPFRDYYSSRMPYHFEEALEENKIVDIAGTGTVAFHTSTINLSMKDFKIPYMTDLWLSYTAHAQEIPIISIKRSGSWLKCIFTEGIWEKVMRDKDLLQKNTELCKEIIKFCK